MGGIAAWAGIVLAFGSLVVAIIALCKTGRLQARVVEIEEQRESDRQVEKQKASLRHKTRRGGRREFTLDGKHYATDLYFVDIVNKGAAKARNFSVLFDGKAKHRAVRVVPPDNPIDPDGRAEFQLAPPDIALPKRITITWEDDSGEPGRHENILTF